MPEIRVIGTNASYTKETRGSIPDQWADWDYEAISGVIGDEVYGVSHGFEPGNGFQYLCGLPVTTDAEVPNGQIELRLPAGKYAVYVHDGHVSGISTLFDAIMCGDRPDDGLIFTDSPQFELYGEGFDPIRATGRVELWFPVARKN